MPYSLNDVIKIELHQSFLGQDFINSVFYRIVETFVGEVTQLILEELIDRLLTQLSGGQSTQLDHTVQYVYNLTDGITVDTVLDTRSGGDGTGIDDTSFSAVGMTKVVESRITRPGSIRFGGFRQDLNIGNNLTSGAVTFFSGVGSVFGASQVVTIDTDTVTFKPVVVGTALDGSYDLTRVNNIIEITNPRLTTQNSRKP